MRSGTSVWGETLPLMMALKRPGRAVRDRFGTSRTVTLIYIENRLFGSPQTGHTSEKEREKSRKLSPENRA